MTRKNPVLDDPLVAEVRRWRSRLQNDGGGTVKGLMSLIRASHDREIASRKTSATQRKPALKSSARRKAG